MDVFKLKMNQGLLDCSYCHRPFRPHPVGTGAFMCVDDGVGFHIFCGRCICGHRKTCPAVHIHYSPLDGIVSRIKVKCNCQKYFPYNKFLEHQCKCLCAKSSAPPVRRECILDRSNLICSECEVPLRPPLFRHCSRNLLVCSGCYHGDITTYRHFVELEYLVHV